MKLRRIHILLGCVFFILGIIVILQFKSKAPIILLKNTKEPKVTINSTTFIVMLATTSAERERGLSGRVNMAENKGMLFIFDYPSHYSFWMHEMKFPLDMIFILNDRVVSIYENLPPLTDGYPNPAQWGSEVVSDRVLEINAGLAKKYGIKVGDEVRFNIKN